MCVSVVHITCGIIVTHADENALTADTLARRLQHCNAEQLSAVFNSATAEQQSEIIRHKLRALQRRLAPEDYASLTHLFRDNLRLAADHPPPGTRDSTTSPRRAAQSAADVCRGKMETLARQVMFATVRGMESRLGEIVARRRAYLTHQTILQYHALLYSLIHHAGDAEVCDPDPDDDEGCFSTGLDQLLRDLADIDQCRSADGDDPGWSDHDRNAVLAMAAELSLGWFAGSTTLCVGGQRAVVPNVADLCYQKLLLYNAAVSPHVTQLSVLDVDEQLNNIQTSSDVEQPLPAAWSVSNIILAETAGHVYRLLHGLERCCSLASPSCVLTGFILYDRLCQLHQHGGPDVQQRARQQKVVENHAQAAAGPGEKQKTAKEGEKDQSACKKPRPVDKSSPESG